MVASLLDLGLESVDGISVLRGMRLVIFDHYDNDYSKNILVFQVSHNPTNSQNLALPLLGILSQPA